MEMFNMNKHQFAKNRESIARAIVYLEQVKLTPDTNEIIESACTHLYHAHDLLRKYSGLKKGEMDELGFDQHAS